MTQPRRLAYDCEFIEQGPTREQPRPSIDLVSIALVDIDNPGVRPYYAVSSEFDIGALIGREWLWQNVAPFLPWRWSMPAPHRAGETVVRQWPKGLDLDDPRVKPRRQIADEVADFILGGEQYPVELWADYGSYDHVVTSWLWGAMIDRPAGIPMWTHDLRMWVELLDLAEADLPRRAGGRVHDALADAEHLAECVRFVDAERAARVHIEPRRVGVQA